MIVFNKKLLKEFWESKKKAEINFEKEVENYVKGKGWFKTNEDALFRFLSRRSVKLEARITKTEIEKIIRKHIPFSTVKRWEGNELIVDVDVIQLRREVIRETQVFTFKKEVTMSQGRYTICPVIKEESQKYFLLVQ